MKTNFQMLREYNHNPKRFGVLMDSEVKKIKEHFQLEKRTDIDLQNFRDFAVMYYGRTNKGEDDRIDMKSMDAMSAITGVVDMIKWERGMEV